MFSKPALRSLLAATLISGCASDQNFHKFTQDNRDQRDEDIAEEVEDFVPSVDVVLEGGTDEETPSDDGSIEAENPDRLIVRNLVSICGALEPSTCADDEDRYAHPSEWDNCVDQSNHILDYTYERLADDLPDGQTPEQFYDGDLPFDGKVACEVREYNALGYDMVRCEAAYAPLDEDENAMWDEAIYCRVEAVDSDGDGHFEGSGALKTTLEAGGWDNRNQYQSLWNIELDPMDVSFVPAYEFNNNYWFAHSADAYTGADVSDLVSAFNETGEDVAVVMDIIGNPFENDGYVEKEYSYRPDGE